MDALGGAGAQQSGDLPELALGDEGGESLLHPDGRCSVLGLGSPDHGAGVSLVAEYGVDGALEPPLPPGAGYALGVEGLGDVEGALAL